MSEIRPTQEQINTMKANREGLINNLAGLDKLLLAGANPDSIAEMKEKYQEEITRIDRFLSVYE